MALPFPAGASERIDLTPTLFEPVRLGALPLSHRVVNRHDRSALYSGGAKGYTDYPALG